MVPPVLTAAAAELDSIVEAFESTRQRQGAASLLEFLPEPGHRYYREIATELVRVEMELSWDEGAPRRLDSYLQLLPGLFSSRETLNEVAYEEYRLRIQHGESTDPLEYSSRYGIVTDSWNGVGPSASPGKNRTDESSFQDSLARGWHDVQQLAEEITDFPTVGERILDFRLERELGRGAFARVFLARQEGLANRPVVLKIAAGKSLEPQHLARLQHTNIVPIYSVHQHAAFTVVCMPYFGDRTVANLVRHLEHGQSLPQSGQALLSTVVAHLDETQVSSGDPQRQVSSIPQNATEHLDHEQILRRSKQNYEEAILELVAQIAEGLRHAHQRGIVHRDLKPANVLLTTDGRAMLLDFNLSENAAVNGIAGLAVGGTLPYMSPEHLRAMLRGGKVDFQGDIYSLGVIFYELLTGQQPYPIHRGPLQKTIENMLLDRSGVIPSVRAQNAKVSPSVEAIVRKCLAPNLQDRYQSVAELHEDLQCQFAFRPLLHAGNPSLKERTTKWARRHPKLSSAASVAAVACTILVAIGWFTLRTIANQFYQEFNSRFPQARTALSIPESDPLLIGDGLKTVRSALAEYGVGVDARWQRPFTYHFLAKLDRQQLETDLGELAYHVASATKRLAAIEGEPQRFEDALRWNRLAASSVPSEQCPRAFEMQHAELLAALGRSEEATKIQKRAEQLPHEGLLDTYIEAQNLVLDRNFKDALPALLDLRDQSPTDPVVWLLLGNTYAGLAKHQHAEGCFSAAVALLPESYVSLHHRGLCYMNLGEPRRALMDFDSVLQLRPELSPCLLNRALAQQSLGNHRDAIEDFSSALERGATQTRIYFLRATSHDMLGQREPAAADRALGLKLTPSDEESWVARGIARLASEPKGARSDFQAALEINPRSVSALMNLVHVDAELLSRPEDALKSLNRMIEIDNKNPDALAGRAVLRSREGQRAEALQDLQALLQVSKEPIHLFQAACVLSLSSSLEASDGPKALLLLSRAILQDPRLLARAQKDPDLALVRKTQGFQNLLEASQGKTS